METFVFSIVFFSLAILAMAVGVILGGRSLSGSCGGSGASGGEACACSLADRLACVRRGRQAPPAD